MISVVHVYLGRDLASCSGCNVLEEVVLCCYTCSTSYILDELVNRVVFYWNRRDRNSIEATTDGRVCRSCRHVLRSQPLQRFTLATHDCDRLSLSQRRSFTSFSPQTPIQAQLIWVYSATIVSIAVRCTVSFCTRNKLTIS